MLKSNLRQAWRWWSVRVSAFGAILMMLLLAAPDIWNALPAQLIAQLPDHVVKIVSLLLFVTTMVARIVPQGGSGAPTAPTAATTVDDMVSRMSSVETTLDALAGAVQTKVATTYAIDAIAQATLKPSSILALDTASHISGITFDAQSGRMTFSGSHNLGSVGTSDGAVKYGE